MDNKLDKHIEKLVDKAMKNSTLESPSLDFTKTVMEQVNALGQSTITTYKPLISKPMWIVIFAVCLAVVLYILFGGTNFESGWFNRVDFTFLTENKISNAFTSLKVSRTVMYSVVLFGIMIGIQTLVLKKYFDKRLAV